MSEEEKKEHLLFLDYETTGLKPVKNHLILEAGLLLVEAKAMVVIDSKSFLCSHPMAAITERMDPTVVNMHTENGLLRDLQDPLTIKTKTHEGLQTAICAFLDYHIEVGRLEKGKIIVAGNTIDFDRDYTEEHLPRFFEYLHYRKVDVRGFQIIYKAWHGKMPDYEKAHRALPDARQSFENLRFFQSRLSA